jgi:Family of unknown function (DUF6662)
MTRLDQPTFKRRRSPRALALGTMTALMALAPWQEARADESPFAYTYLTEVLPQGGMEIEQWLTWKHKKPQEKFDQLQGRTEFEYGFSNRFQGALYLNYEHTKIEPEGPGAPNDFDDTTKFTGVNAEFIYQVWSPFTDPFGFALYFEPSIGDGERALEFKLLFQKNFFEDRLIFATNFILEYEWEHEAEEDIWEHASAFEITVALAYRVAPGWFAGVEFLNENEYAEHIFSGAHAEVSKFYFGPTIHYATQNWWATLGFYKQLPWASNHTDEAGLVAHGYVYDAERTRLRFRLGIIL